MARIYVKPATGLSIPSPNHNGQALPLDGAWVDASRYWTKRLNAEDVSDDTEAQAKKEAEAERAAAEKAEAEAKAAEKAAKIKPVSTPNPEGSN